MRRSVAIPQRQIIGFVAIAIVGLIVVAGAITVSRITDRMNREADAQLDVYIARR